MDLTRRRTLRALGASMAVTGLAGCDGVAGGDPPRDDTPGDDATNGDATDDGVEAYDTLQFAVTAGRGPERYDEDGASGRSIVVDSEQRERSVLGRYDPKRERAEELQAFLEDLDYDEERLILIEAAGPNACFDTLDVDDVRVEDDRVRATATVTDANDPDERCAQVVVHLSALLRVSFREDPVDEVAIEVIDGWGEESVVTASVDDSLAPDVGDLEGHVRPDGDPIPAEALGCDDDAFERHPPGYNDDTVHLGEIEDDGDPVLAMRVGDTAYDRGDTLTIDMTNVSDETVHTGNHAKFNLQINTEVGWQDIRGADDGQFAYTDEAVGHPPGEGFQWNFELTETGVVADAPHDFRVCPDLPEGRYRFAFWGVIGPEALAVEFDLVG